MVAVGAHQDDIELFCLGTMLRYARSGHHLAHVVLTNGDKGGHADPTIPHTEVAAIRNAEARAVAEAIGASYTSLGAEDAYLQDTPELRHAVAATLREHHADVVLAPPPLDYNSDHTVASAICFQACLLASMPTIESSAPPLDKAPALFYVDAITAPQPTHYVNITDEFERKRELLGLHRSQVEILRSFGDAPTLLHVMTVIAQYRGLQANVRYAEAFQHGGAWPRLSTKSLLPSD